MRSMIKTNLLLIAFILVLGGCAAKQPISVPVGITETITVYATCGSPPPRDDIILVPITWVVQEGRFSLSPEDYKKLSFNMAQTTKGVKQLRAEINYYEKCLSRGKDGSI